MTPLLGIVHLPALFDDSVSEVTSDSDRPRPPVTANMHGGCYHIRKTRSKKGKTH